MNNKYLNIAIPKGRLQKDISEYFSQCNITVKESSRKLDYIDKENGLRFLFVKNSDVPVYVSFGVADIGISGTDTLYESEFEFIKLLSLPFGSTKMCIAGYEKDKDTYFNAGKQENFMEEIRIATKFTKFTQDLFNKKNMPIKIIKLSGSVELGPILGLSDFILDLVETGKTLEENDLSIIEEVGQTKVEIIANPSSYKVNYKKIDLIISKIANIKGKK